MILQRQTVKNAIIEKLINRIPVNIQTTSLPHNPSLVPHSGGK